MTYLSYEVTTSPRGGGRHCSATRTNTHTEQFPTLSLYDGHCGLHQTVIPAVPDCAWLHTHRGGARARPTRMHPARAVAAPMDMAFPNNNHPTPAAHHRPHGKRGAVDRWASALWRDCPGRPPQGAGDAPATKREPLPPRQRVTSRGVGGPAPPVPPHTTACARKGRGAEGRGAVGHPRGDGTERASCFGFVVRVGGGEGAGVGGRRGRRRRVGGSLKEGGTDT